MSATVNIERAIHFYGETCRERWRATYRGLEGFEYELRMLPEEGSNPLFVLADVPPSGVPDEVLDMIDEELEAASGVPA